RLDNVVYRLGLANTRSAARQLVSHGHVLVNGRSVNIASYNVKAGDEITIKDKPKSRQLVLRNLELTQIAPVPDWLTANRDALSGKVAHIPSREEMQPIVNEQLIVELYSREKRPASILLSGAFPGYKPKYTRQTFAELYLTSRG